MKKFHQIQQKNSSNHQPLPIFLESLSNSKVRALSNVNAAYEGVENDIVRAKTKGYIHSSKITKRELKDLALKNNIIHILKKENEDDYTEQAAYMALNKNLIEPLLAWNFISIDKIGTRHIVSLTSEGQNALKFLNIKPS